MEEAEALCEDIALIAGGRIAARGTAADLKERYGVGTLEDVYLRTVARSLEREAAPL
jgi:ABC-2 type transport system ATP-binding protein